jgi:hypothetical protein
MRMKRRNFIDTWYSDRSKRISWCSSHTSVCSNLSVPEFNPDVEDSHMVADYPELIGKTGREYR